MGTPAQTLQQERLRYPGLLPREIIVLRNWLKLHEQEFERFDYNVRIGAGFDPGPTYPDYIRKQALDNTRKRVDAVAWRGNEATLIEVKDRAGAAAVGQLVTYDAIWRQEHPELAEPRMLLVANRFAADIYPILARAGIQFEAVAANFAELLPQAPRRGT